MNTKQRFIRIMEVYLNMVKKESVELMYGKGTQIRIHNLNYSSTEKSIMVESVIVLGDLINEETLNRELADILVKDVMNYIFPEYSVKNYVRWDV